MPAGIRKGLSEQTIKSTSRANLVKRMISELESEVKTEESDYTHLTRAELVYYMTQLSKDGDKLAVIKGIFPVPADAWEEKEARAAVSQADEGFPDYDEDEEDPDVIEQIDFEDDGLEPLMGRQDYLDEIEKGYGITPLGANLKLLDDVGTLAALCDILANEKMYNPEPDYSKVYFSFIDGLKDGTEVSDMKTWMLESPERMPALDRMDAEGEPLLARPLTRKEIETRIPQEPKAKSIRWRGMPETFPTSGDESSNKMAFRKAVRRVFNKHGLKWDLVRTGVYSVRDGNLDVIIMRQGNQILVETTPNNAG